MASVTMQLSTAVTGHKTLEDVLWVVDLLHRFDFSQAHTHTHTHTLYICINSWEIIAFLQLESIVLPENLVYLEPKGRDTCTCVCTPACTVPCYCDVCVWPADTASVSPEEVVCLFLFSHHSAARQQPHLLSVWALTLHATKLSQLQELAVQIFR